MGQYSSYDILGGLERVMLLYLAATIGLVVPLSLQLYTNLKAQDRSLAEGVALDIRTQVLLTAKRAILWVFGYKGEQREKTPFDGVDLNWVNRYRPSIIFRLVPIYGLYILGLVVLTRPIFFDGKAYHIFSYSTNLHDLFVLFVIYVSSNIMFDYLSLKFTFSCILQALTTKKYAFSFAKNATFAVPLFIFSQTVSCFLWVYKRQDPNFPHFDNGIIHNFFEIALSPYAFVTGTGSAQITSEPFPGQLLITGTVFIPTMLLVSVFILFSAFLKSTEVIKKLLLSHQLDRFCRLFLRVRLIGPFEPEKLARFGYCNLAFTAFLDLSLVAVVGALVARLL